jgi:serine/threonine protein phosphatase PrpC
MKRKPVRSAAVSDPGNLRGNNEDRVYCDDERGIYVVIDGVGGEAGGERAAAIAEAELLARLERATGSIEDRIREGIALAGKRIFEHARRNPELTGMACVLTAAVVSNGEAVVGHVGDTRLYKIRGGAIEKVTRDHSPVGAREDAGEISEREAMQHPRRNEIFRDVGSEERAPDERDFVEIHRIGFEEDSALLLCSDGLTDQVPSSTILDAVARHSGDPTRIARELVRRANDAGGKDNVSIVYVEGPAFAAAVPVKRRRWLPLAAALFAGIALGAVAGVGGYRQWLARSPAPRQTLVVSRDGLATIGEALRKARPGDTVEVGAGIYRERLELPEGVHLVARPPGGAVIEPRADAVQPAAALAIERLKSGSVAGFRIAAVAAGTSASPGQAQSWRRVTHSYFPVPLHTSTVVRKPRSRDLR